jgi:hypothetical protein
MRVLCLGFFSGVGKSSLLLRFSDNTFTGIMISSLFIGSFELLFSGSSVLAHFTALWAVLAKFKRPPFSTPGLMKTLVPVKAQIHLVEYVIGHWGYLSGKSSSGLDLPKLVRLTTAVVFFCLFTCGAQVL